MDQYYSERLSGSRLKKCYEIAQPRIQQYLEAEIEHVSHRVLPDDSVLELGCGYGRVLRRLVGSCGSIVGIDTSYESLRMAQQTPVLRNVAFFQMNASGMGFADSSFDVVVCVQNGISAFGLEPSDLVRESVRVTRHGGLCLFSSYSEKIWVPRLEWFRLQSETGLLGQIDWERTRDGVIVCMDGFRAATFSQSDFIQLAVDLSLNAGTVEIDSSSLFLEIRVEK